MLVEQLEKSSSPVTPILFLHSLFVAFPQFAEKGENGGNTQQVCPLA